MDQLRKQFQQLEAKASAADLWDSQDKAQSTLQEMSDLRGVIEEVEGFQALMADAQTAIELAQLEVCRHAAPQPLPTARERYQHAWLLTTFWAMRGGLGPACVLEPLW